MTREKALVTLLGRVVIITKENSRLMRGTGTVKCTGVIKVATKVIGRRVCSMGMAV